MRITLQTVKQLSDLLRSRRKQLGISQAAVAAQLGVSQEWVSSLERSPGQMSVSQLVAITELLGLALDLTARTTPGAQPAASPAAPVGPRTDPSDGT